MPVATPDPELSLLAERLEKKYHAPTEQGGLGRGPTETFVDQLGASRWRRDYFLHRDGGASPDEAWRRVNRAINDIVPELTGDVDPNFPGQPSQPPSGAFPGRITVAGDEFQVPS